MGFSDQLAELANLSTAHGLRGIVTGLCENGQVNVRVDGGMLYSVPCTTSYSTRTPGDVVHLALSSGIWVVTGKFGGDPSFVGPTQKATRFQVYSMTDNTPFSALGGTELGVVPGQRTGTVGYLACGFWDVVGGTNKLTTGAAGKTNVWVYVARDQSAIDSAPVALKLYPHNTDQLPLSGALTTVATSNALTDVGFTLERGEQKMIKLPSDWVTAIKAVTPTIRGFVISPNPTSADAMSRYILMSTTAGAFRAV